MLIRMTRYLGSGRRFVYSDAILNLVLMHCLGMQLCFAFSVHLPMSDDGSLLDEEHDVRSAAERFDHSPFQIHKRPNSKTATCTCTCETRPEDGYNEDQVQETEVDWNNDDNKIPVHGKPADEPADEPIAKPSVAAPATARPPLPPGGGHSVEVSSDHSLNKLTADKVSELEAADNRFPWKSLPDRLCYREPCASDRDCCLRFNICDRSAHICIDCWYGSSCMTDRDCCSKYPHCRPPQPPQLSSDKDVVGRCIAIK